MCIWITFFVDADDLVSVPHVTETILDFAINVFHVRSSHKRNFELKTPKIDSASGSRGN